MPPFVPAAQLCRDFYAEILAPALAGVPHTAGLFGPGSDVLGLDTERSTDHDWGPRATVFVDHDQGETARARLDAVIPETFRGHPVRIGRDDRSLEHHVTVDTLDDWLAARFGAGMPREPVDWLLIPQQRLLEVTAGPVFADPLGALGRLRERLAWYPDDVWWWLMACQWRRIAQEEPFVRRTAEVGDALGSAVLTARLVRDVIRLALLIGRRYAPYGKWLGTAFRALPDPDGLRLHLAAALRISGDSVPNGSPERGLAGSSRADPTGIGAPDRAAETALGAAYSALARRHAALPGAEALDPGVRPFFDRPALVIGADRFVADCLRQVTDPRLRALPLVGAIDQFTDGTDLLAQPPLVQQLRRVYQAEQA